MVKCNKKIGGEVSTSDLDDIVGGVNVFSVTYTEGLSASPVDVSVTASKTTTLWSFNIADTVKRAWNEVKSGFD